jgi:hypothetical protein
MAKRKWTEEQRKAFGAKMKAAREAKGKKVPADKSPQPTLEKNIPLPTEGEQLEKSMPANEEAGDLRARVRELEDLVRKFATTPPQDAGAQVTSRGIVGTVTKHSIVASDYPDPRERLFGERRLQLKGFNSDWFELSWEVKTVSYETKDGLNMREPKFQIKLIKVVEDEVSGEPTDKRYVICKGSFFEDPQAALEIAKEQGVEVPAEAHKPFLDEMRYLRIRDWLFDAFYPPKSTKLESNKKEAVIGNRLVEVYEISSENPQRIPFDQLRGKV